MNIFIRELHTFNSYEIIQDPPGAILVYKLYIKYYVSIACL